LIAPLRELRRLLRLRLGESRDTVGYNVAAMRLISRIAGDQKEAHGSDTQHQDIWAGMGLGSDVAAALEGKAKKKSVEGRQQNS